MKTSRRATGNRFRQNTGALERPVHSAVRSAPGNGLRHRPEIDGLRAVAVLAVVFFHAGFGCSGGYVGVDVFFVISGFLITSLIWNDLESGRFTFAHFWERRARRILPALVVVAMAALVAGWFLLLPADFRDLAKASEALAVIGANFFYWQDSGYFAGAADQKPLLHTWSLAVEEQFYLVVPFLLWAMYRYPSLRRRKWVFSALAVGFVLSFTASVHGVAHHRTGAFYLLPSRAWELGLGSLVAFLPVCPSWMKRRTVRELLGWMGLAMILSAVFTYTPQTPFPGAAALAPCLGTAALIWANGRTEGGAPTAVGALLSLRPVTFIGLISYSLYLWHWPFLAFSRYLALTPLSLAHRTALLGLGFLCAVLSWKYVETPFRRRRLGSSRKSMFAFAGAGLAGVFGCGLVCMIGQGFPGRWPARALRFAHAASAESFVNELTVADVRAGKLVRIGKAAPGLRPTVFVWGDSHAMAAMPAFDALLKQEGLAGRAATHSATPPVLGWFNPGPHGLGRLAVPYNNAVFSYIRSRHIPNVILCARWSWYVDANAEGNHAFQSALVDTVRRLVAVGCRTWVLLDVPIQPFNVPVALSRSVITHRRLASLCARPSPRKERDGMTPNVLLEIKAAGGRILDPKPCFLDSTGRRYVIQRDGVVLYRDNHHLTPKGARLILLPFLRQSLTLNRPLNSGSRPGSPQSGSPQRNHTPPLGRNKALPR